jgi:hypothetical protein
MRFFPQTALQRCERFFFEREGGIMQRPGLRVLLQGLVDDGQVVVDGEHHAHAALTKLPENGVAIEQRLPSEGNGERGLGGCGSSRPVGGLCLWAV